MASSSRHAVRPWAVLAAPVRFSWATAPLVPVEADLLRMVSTELYPARVVCPGGNDVTALTNQTCTALWTDKRLTDDHLIAVFSLFNARLVTLSYTIDTSLSVAF